MKKLMTCICTFFIFYQGIAQDFTLKWDEPGKNEDFNASFAKRPHLNSSRTFGKSKVKISEDGLKVLFVFEENSSEKNENVKLKIQIKDTTLKVIEKEKKIELSYINKYFEVMEIFISNDNMVYICVAIEETAKLIRKSANASFALKILRIDMQNGTSDEFLINPENKYVNDCNIILEKNGKLYGFGLFSNDGPGGLMSFHRNIHGYFTFELDKSSKELKPNITNKVVGDDIIKALRSDEKMGLGPSFKIKNMWHKENGGYVVILESWVNFIYYNKGYSYNSQTGGIIWDSFANSSSVSNLFWDLIYLNIDPSDKLIFSAHIPKRQKDANENTFASIYSIYKNNKVYIVFNDHEQNVKNNNFEKHMNGPEIAQPVLLTINEDGTYKKQPLAESYKKTKIKMSVVKTMKVNNSEATLVDLGIKNKIRFGHLTIH